MTVFRPDAPQGEQTSSSLRAELLLAVFLIGLVVAVRLLPHALNFTPLAAAALFAGAIFRQRSLALLVPLAALLLSDLAIGFDDWRIMIVVYGALALTAAAGMQTRRYRPSRAVIPTMLACSLMFYATTNFAVWAFGGIYSLDMAGLIQCYVAALPFLKHTVAGDLFWTAVLFGGAWLLSRRSQPRPKPA
jgi:hypothetical protein